MTDNNLLGIPATELPAEPEVLRALEGAESLADLEAVVVAHPESALAWATLAHRAFDPSHPLTAYAYARVGYHRGLDALRRAGWRGQGPVPWSHEPNRGVLRALYELRRGAEAIGESAEVTRLTDFLRGADETCVARIELDDAPAEPAPTTEAFFIRGLD